MATGKSGDIVFESKNKLDGIPDSRFKLHYVETYDIAGNYSDITFSDFQVAGYGLYGRVVFIGTIKANGSAIVSLNDKDINCNVLQGNNTFYHAGGSDSGGIMGWPKTIRVPHGTDGKKTISISIEPYNSGYANFILYFAGPPQGSPYNSTSQNLVLTDIPRGLVKIHDGSSFQNYSVHIYNGSAWDRYTPYIHNGSSWEAYNGG